MSIGAPPPQRNRNELGSGNGSAANGQPLCPLETPIGSLVKHKRAAGSLVAREHLTQNDVVVAGLVDRGDPAAELSGGPLEEWQPVCAERQGEIVETMLKRPRKAGGQLGLMLAKNVDREQTAFADRSPGRAAFVGAKQEEAWLKRNRCQRIDRCAEQFALTLRRDDGDAGWEGTHDRAEALAIDGRHVHITTFPPADLEQRSAAPRSDRHFRIR